MTFIRSLIRPFSFFKAGQKMETALLFMKRQVRDTQILAKWILLVIVQYTCVRSETTGLDFSVKVLEG